MSARTLSSTSVETGIKRLLRDRESQAYFKDGAWTRNADEASSFSDVVEVAETCAQYGLKNVELALRCDVASCDFFCTTIR